MKYGKWIFGLVMIICFFLKPISGETQTGVIEPEWGTSSTTCKSIPATTFTPISDLAARNHLSGGWIYRVGGVSSLFDANVDLPTGAKIRDIYVNAVDTAESFDVYAWVQVCPIDDTDWCYSYPSDNSLKTSGTTGYARLYKDMSDQNITVDNLNNSYLIRVLLAAEDSSNRFRSVQVCYALQVSPDPAFASFGDVPIGHWAHQYVEALYASGITEGYADGTFRPGAYVTRGQMAAFLSRALGLHWPN